MMEAFGLTDPGCVRTNNEDYFLVYPELGLYLVADGMGGAKAGEKASRLAAETVAEVVHGSGVRDSSVLNLAFHEANRRVRTLAASDRAMEGMGTTLVAILEFGDSLELASVGDSRCYRMSAGTLELLTVDQTWVQEVGLKLGLDEEKLRNHPYRHVLTMAIGATNSLKVNLYTLPANAGDSFLICSDGLHGVISEEIIKNTVSDEKSLEAKCHSLVEAAHAAGAPDNVTTVLLQRAG
jgi:PPM family protein phosphatase